MKQYYFVFLFFITGIANAQEEITYYNHHWEKCDPSLARFYSIIKKTDSGWFRNDYFVSTNRLQMSALFKDSTCGIINGYASYFYANGNMEAFGKRTDNRQEGLYIKWHANGVMADSGHYVNDRMTGTRLLWHPNGVISDSMVKTNDSIHVSVSWFDNGNPSCYGYYINGKKNGRWNYFHKNGKAAAVELNEKGKQVAAEYFNEDGIPLLEDTTSNNRQADFKGGAKKWKDYLLDNTYWPSSYKITNSDRATVEVSFTINEDGKTENAFVSIPFHYLLDKIALDIILKSPAWVPALDHNRRIKAYRRQSITFTQE